MVGLHSCIAQSYGCTMFIWILHCMAHLSLCSLCAALSFWVSVRLLSYYHESIQIIDWLKFLDLQHSGSTQTSRHPKGEERDLHNDNMKQTNAKGKETHVQK